MTSQRDEYDNPWKEAITIYFQAFIELLFPEVYARVDWTMNYEFLDTQLQQVTREDEVGERIADKLVKVWLIDGTETWILIHVEVQSQYQQNFAERMYVYNSRIFGLYRQKVVSLAVLADDSPSWRPDRYEYEICGCRVLLQFGVAKLLDYQEQWQVLERSSNPFSAIVMAHLKTQGTRQQPRERLQWKLSIVKALYQQGYSRRNIRELFRLIGWMMSLPTNLERGFEEEIHRFEEESRMPYITGFERRGMVASRREDIVDILQTRFAAVPDEVVSAIGQIYNLERLRLLHRQAVTISSLAEYQEIVDRALAEERSETEEFE